MKGLKAILALAIVGTSLSLTAQIVPQIGEISTIYQGTPVVIGQPEAETSVTMSAPGGNQLDVKVINRIHLGVDIHYKEYFGTATKTKVKLDIERWGVNQNQLSDTTVYLELFYNPFTDSTYIAGETARFSGAYEMNIVIDSIYVDDIPEQTLPANLFVHGEILAVRYTDYTGTPVNFSQLDSLDKNCNGIKDGLRISWNPVMGAQEYQLEWLHVNDYGYDPLSPYNPSVLPISSNAIAYNFKYNSTRITTTNTEYDLSLIFDKGYVLFRVRAIGVGLSNLNQPIYGLWNEDESGVVSDIAYSYHITDATKHESTLNWQYSATYAEEGKKKEIISYFDGSLRNRQTVTSINTDENVIVGETIYDHQGRPAINVLPTPVVDPTCQAQDPNKIAAIQFYANYNQNLNNGEGYSRSDFDIDDPNASCAIGASGMGIQSGSSYYYSPENQDKVNEQAYVPDAKKYPFTQVEYTPDNTGRIRRQGGVGPEFQLGTNHETKYFYGQPNQLELDRLFGSEVGDATHYKKNVVIDAHGQASISYLDQEGRVIATALAGRAPANLQGITSSFEDSIKLEVNAFGQNDSQNRLSIEGNAIVFNTSLLVAFESDYTFAYDFEVTPIQDECLPTICIDCVYDLKLELRNECGDNLFPAQYENQLVGNFSGDEQSGYIFHSECGLEENPVEEINANFTISNLKPGSYTLTKRLTINEEARQAFIDLYLDSTKNDCILTLYDFQLEELALVDSSDCAVDCDQCLEDLGTLEDYVASGLGSSNDYYLQMENCEKICDGGSFSYCDAAYSMMRTDMAPGGQYGQYNLTASGQLDFSNLPLSIYQSNNVLPEPNAFWNLPQLVDEYGVHPIFVDENGDTSRIYVSDDGNGNWLPTPINPTVIKFDPVQNQYYIYAQELNFTSDFIDLFEYSWTKSLVFYHPEYCYYENCIKFEDEVIQGDAYTSQLFDDLLNETTTFQDAIANGFLPNSYNFIFNGNGNGGGNGNGNVGGGNQSVTTNWFAYTGNNTNDNHTWDPFVVYGSDFSVNGCTDFGGILESRFDNYKVIGGVMRSMPEVAAYTARCGMNFYANPANTCYDFGGPFNGSYDIDILNQEWNILKALYRGEKQTLFLQLLDCIALNECEEYAGCIGNDNYNPFTAGMINTSLGGFASSPFFQQDFQPCNLWMHQYYVNKDRRFAPASAVVPIQDANEAAYEVYLQTGQCPVTFSFNELLSILAQDQNIDQQSLILNNYGQLTSLFLANNDFNMPGTIPQLYQDIVSVSANTITVNWMQNPAQPNPYATLTMSMPSGVVPGWDALTDIINVYPSGIGFTAEGVYLNGATPAIVPITGSITAFNLATCSFNNVGTTSDLGWDLQQLFSALASAGEFTNPSGIDIDPLGGSGITGFETQMIVNGAGVGSGLSWIQMSAQEYMLYSTGGLTNEGLLVSFQSADPSSFNWNDLSLVSYFDGMVSTGGHSFDVTAYLSNGTSVVLSGDLLQLDGQGGQSGIPVGVFGLPIPAECQTQEHEAFNALYNVLNESLENGNLTGNIDLYASIYLDQSLTEQLDNTLASTSSVYNSNNNVLTISAGECEITLTAEAGLSLTEVAEFISMEVTGSPDNLFNYNDFAIYASFNTGNGIQYGYISGTSCLSLQQCEECPESAITVIENDSIREQRLLSGEFYLDNSVERYTTYKNAIDSFNLNNGLTPSDTAFLVVKEYNYFTRNGFDLPAPGYVRFVESAVLGEDNHGFLKDPDKFVAEYGYGTNVLYEFDRYEASIVRYNQRAQQNGAPSLNPITKIDFVNSRVARNNGNFINYIETQPIGNQGGQNILIYLNATPTAVSAEEIFYKQYSDTYLQFDANQQTNPTCENYKKFTPLYAFEDIEENKLFCTPQGQQELSDYISSFNNACPGSLPERKDCNIASPVENKREDQKLYVLYKEAIKDFNNSYWASQNNFSLNFEINSVQAFIISRFKPCLKQYLAYLSTYTSSTNGNQPAVPPVPISQFGPCVGTLPPDDPCKETYAQYIDCIREYNDWAKENQFTYFFKEIAEYKSFIQYGMCECVDEFCSRLNEIEDGLVTFATESDFHYYLSWRNLCEKPCTPEPMSGLPAQSAIVELTDDCIEMQINQALFTALLNYENYVDSLSNELINEYNAHCLDIDENFTYKYNDKLYHFTLYYYDQAGNLIKTIPPAGVERLNTTNSNDALSLQIASDRSNSAKTVFTEHRMATRYEYNSLNQLVAQSSPDTDPMNLFELTLPNGLNSKLITRSIQMVTENRGYLAGELPVIGSTGITRGVLYQTNDGGTTWQRVYNLAGTDLKKSVMVDAQVGFAIGSKGIVLKTADAGNSWDMVDFWEQTLSTVDLNDILYFDNSGTPTVVVVGNDGMVAQTTDMNTFTFIPGIGTQFDILSVTTDGNELFVTTATSSAISGTTATVFSRSVNGGVWTELNAFSTPELFAISLTSGNRAIGGGFDGRLYVNADISIPTNRWQMLETNVSGKITDLEFFNDQQGIAIIDSKLYRTADGGANWIQIGNENHTHLSVTQSKELILAVGDQAKMAIYVPSANPMIPSIDVASNLIPNPIENLRSSWVDKSGSDYMIVSSGEDRRVHITFNGQELLPTWTSTDFSTVLQVNEYLTDLKIRRNGATNLDGIGLTNSGRLFYLKKTGTAVTLTLKTNNVKSIVYEQNNPVAYAFFNTGQVQRINLNTGNLFNAGTISSWLAPNAAIKLSSRISGVGSGLGHILVPGLNITTVTNQSLMTNPVKLNVAEFHTTANTVRIAGTDGTLYERNGGAWVIVRTQSNKDIYAVQEKAGEIFVAGETGYFTNGTVSGGVYNSTDIVLTTGLTAEQSVNDHLYDIAIDQEKIYAVGANGRVVFKPGTFVPFASVVQGTNDIYGVNVNVNGIYTVGEGSEIHFVSGANYIKKKDIYTPPMRDVHFSTATIGSIVADNFTVRTTIDGGLNWTAVVPNVLPVAADYAQVWTVDANRSLIFGNGLPFESLSNNANQLPTGPIQVTDLDRQGNTLYVANTNSVYLMNLTANTFGTPISISGQAKGIKARQNGAFAVTGENGYFACYDLSGTSTYTAIPSLLNSADFNDLEIVDNNRIVLVGDDGAWWETSETQYDVNGNLNGAIWFDQTGIYAPGSDPYDVTAGNMVNIYDVEFATAVDGILGGEYNPSFWYYNAASYAYVRKFYAPGARYSARFFYDKLGRLIVSQNSRQYTEEDGNGNPTPKFSYTLYDALGRVVEVGEKTENPTSASSVTFKNVFGTNVSGFFNPSVIDDNNLVAWVNGNGPRKEVTKSYYDATIISITDPNVNFAPNELTQRKRIVHVTYEGVFDGNDQTYDHASHYDYDIHGNVKTLVQDNQKMANEFPSIADQRYKRMDYLYDLVSGNVHRMSVQDGELDQWHHAYRYDADNRIISAHTNKETPILSSSGSEAVISQALENELVQNTDWQQDAKYFYYDHGPLARTELGEQQLQGMDYVYNLQGWMKGVNATSLDVNVDPGRDGASTSLSGQPNNPNEVFANDVMAFSLHYYDQFDYEDENGNPVTTNDYTPIGAGGLTPLISVLPAANITNSDIAANSNDLFNGNIKAMQTTLTNPTTYDAMPMGNAYQYDQLNRLLSSKSFINLSGNQWGNSGTYDNRYLNTFEYDAMGNIIHQNRYTEAGVQIEDMSYGYKRDTDGNLLRNRLYHINEPVGLTSLDDSDIDDMGGTFNPQLLNIETAYNYAYDEEGRLIKDSTEKIDLIVWRVDGKVKEIHRPAGSDKKNISFDYDAMGNRIAKHVFDDDWNLEKTTHYLLDAQGNQMSVYEHEVANSNVTYTLKERHIYGSSSLGILMDSILMGSSTSGNTVNELGLKTYSMSNHLGNVLTVISDIKIPQASGGTTTTGYRVGIRNISDYSPFGVLLAERAVENEFFRTGFQGSERDDEVKGDGNSYTTELRQLDPRLGRWLSIDPKTNTYESPYVSMGNNPIFFNDPFGDTLKTDNTQQANSDIKALGGKYQDIIDVSDPNNIVINFDLVKSQEKFQKKGEFNENKFEKYKSKAMKHAGISLINDIASASENILYTSNWVINLSDESGKVYERDFSELSGITEGDNGIAGINNHSTTPRGDEYTSYQPEDPSKIQGHVNIISGKYGYYRISNGVKTLQIITKGSVVYHELRENYLRTVMKMPYPKAHPQSSKDEGITYGNGNPGNATYVKYDEKP